MYNEGISLIGDALDTGVVEGTVKKSGNTYSFGEVKLGVGREASKAYVREHPELFTEIRRATFAAVAEKDNPERSMAMAGAAEDDVPPIEEI
jgi:recombination protein RecA